MLDAGDGQLVYWEVCGNPAGKPALVVHGGPGSGCSPGMRRYFDPARYRIVLFDQRGCGRSLPYAGDPGTDLSVNTTHHLLADMERLRDRLGIGRWLLWGGSWGSTLALAYAQRHPQRVSEIVLGAVTVTGRSDVHWLAHEVGRFLPEEWERFRSRVPEVPRGSGQPGAAPWRDGGARDLVADHYRLLADPDAAVRDAAARSWCAWEDALASLDGAGRDGRFNDPRFRLCFARLVTHYFHHGAWLGDGELLGNVGRLAGIPGLLVHGRHDLSGPPDVAWRLARAWPGAELHIVPGGHWGQPEMTQLLLAATDRWGGLRA